MPRVFLSYAGPDFSFVQRLASQLEEDGHSAFFAPREIRVGDNIPATLENQIRGCDSFVLVATSNVPGRRFIEAEVLSAFRNRKRIIVLRKPSYPGAPEIEFLTGSAVWLTVGNTINARQYQALLNGLRQSEFKGGHVVSVLNLKGGTGKTTVCANLFAALSEIKPQPVLLIDLDPQHNLTQLLLRTHRAQRAREDDRAVISLFEPSKLWGETQQSPAGALEIGQGATPLAAELERLIERPQIQSGPSLSLVVGQFETSKYALSRDGAGIDAAVERFKAMISQLQALFPIIAIDVNPTASFFTDAALSVSTHILAPIMPNVHSYSGVKLLRSFLEMRGQTEAIRRVLPVLNGFGAPNAARAQEDGLRGAIRDNPDFGARTLQPEFPYSRRFLPRNDDPQGLGYLADQSLGDRVKIVADALYSGLREDD